MRQAAEILTTFNKVDGILPQKLWRNNFNIRAQFINLVRKQAEALAQ
ncbi:hypothetical protein [uncultured Campylobacter sp.]|nr:hypothetical protein [uncultured Campylobacter sp.]